MTNKDIDMIQENIRRDSFKKEYWGALSRSLEFPQEIFKGTDR